MQGARLTHDPMECKRWGSISRPAIGFTLDPVHHLAGTVDHRIKTEVFFHRFPPTQSLRAGSHLLPQPEE